jgi:hypothetical protein
MRIPSHNQCVIIQQLIGLVSAVEKKMDGQLFSFTVLLILVIQWMLQSKYVIDLFRHNYHVVSDF